jgi:hypothetical protein
MIDFRQYWNSFFCWSELDFDKNYRRIKNHYLKDYIKYCKHINQEPIYD